MSLHGIDAYLGQIWHLWYIVDISTCKWKSKHDFCVQVAQQLLLGQRALLPLQNQLSVNLVRFFFTIILTFLRILLLKVFHILDNLYRKEYKNFSYFEFDISLNLIKTRQPILVRPLLAVLFVHVNRVGPVLCKGIPLAHLAVAAIF